MINWLLMKIYVARFTIVHSKTQIKFPLLPSMNVEFAWYSCYKLHHHSLSVSAEQRLLNYIEPCIIRLKKLHIPYMYLQFHTQVQIILTALKCLMSPSLLRDDHFTPTKSYLQRRPRGLRYLDVTRNSDPLALFSQLIEHPGCWSGPGKRTRDLPL